MSLRQTGAKAISSLHLACVLFLSFGFLLPKSVLWVHLMLVPLTILQWWFNNNQCILTQWQQRLEGEEPRGKDSEGEFIKSLFARLNLEPSRQQLFIIIYGVLGMAWILSLLRWWKP